MFTANKRTIPLLIGALLYVAALLAYLLVVPELLHSAPIEGVPYPFWGLLAFLPAYIVIGFPVLKEAAHGIRNGHVFDENFLMGVATLGALALGEFPEAVAVMLFYEIGELFEDYAVGKSRDSIAEMMDIAPEVAMLERDGELVEVDPYEVEVGSIIAVRPGERIPLDGVVVEGISELDTSALTGESAPVAVEEGTEVVSGAINLQKTLRIRTTKAYEDSTVARILELVEDAADQKAPMENFITRFARYYTPIVCGAAVAIAVIPPLFTGLNFPEWIERGLVFLVVSCPCALVISVPLSFFGGIGAASRNGILIKGSNYLEALSKVDTILTDKTGTLTQGEFTVVKICPADESQCNADALLEIAALAEKYSTHPISLSIQRAFGQKGELQRVADMQELPGQGIVCTIDGLKVAAGNDKLMRAEGVDGLIEHDASTILHVARDGAYLGHIEVEDAVKEEAPAAIAEMRRLGVKRFIMLTGDTPQAARRVTEIVDIDEYHPALLPHEKMEHLEAIIEGAELACRSAEANAETASRNERNKVAYLGDGINDAPALMRSDVGIAMGAMGSDAAIEAADVVLMDDNLSRLADAIGISRKTMRIVYQNIIFALGVKFVVLLLAAFGLANMWMAIFADVGVTVLAILNAMRMLRYKP